MTDTPTEVPGQEAPVQETPGQEPPAEEVPTYETPTEAYEAAPDQADVETAEPEPIREGEPVPEEEAEAQATGRPLVAPGADPQAEPVYGDPDAPVEEYVPTGEPPEGAPILDAEVKAKMDAAREAGISGDPDAEPGYFVDENFRPNPLDVGTVITTDYHGTDPNDLRGVSGLFANAGVHPLEAEENLPESPEPPPQAEATEYDPGRVNTEGMQADPAQQTMDQTRTDMAGTSPAEEPAFDESVAAQNTEQAEATEAQQAAGQEQVEATAGEHPVEAGAVPPEAQEGAEDAPEGAAGPSGQTGQPGQEGWVVEVEGEGPPPEVTQETTPAKPAPAATPTRSSRSSRRSEPTTKDTAMEEPPK